MQINRKNSKYLQRKKTKPNRKLVFHVKEDGGQQNSKKNGAVPKVVVTAKPQTQVKSRLMWLIGDNRRVRKEQFEKAGWTIGYNRHGSLDKDQRRCLRLRLSTAQPRLIYIVNLGGMGNTQEVSNFISVMITDQLNLRGFIVLEAREDSDLWKMPHGKLTEGNEWYPVVTRWCGLQAEPKATKGEKSDGMSDAKGERLSRLSTYVRANFPLEDRRQCKCGTKWSSHTTSTHTRQQLEDGDKAFAA